MSKQMAFHVDTSSCVGCGSCEIACKDEKNLTVGARPRFVRNFAGGSWKVENGINTPVDVFSYSVSIACNHCNNPVCVEACPTGAMRKDKDTGIVYSDYETCIGCNACHDACPYKAPQLIEEEKKIAKCDFCRSLLAIDMKPACVETCPMRALDYGTIEEMEKKYGSQKDIAPLPKSDITSPNLVLTLHRDAKQTADSGEVIALYRKE